MQADEWAKLVQGRFVVIDGPDGSGKSSVRDYVLSVSKSRGVEPVHVREPGGTVIGEAIRKVVLCPSFVGHLSLPAEFMLFAAARAQLAHEVIRPALRADRFVLSDRFVSSTLAYQGAQGLPWRVILDVTHATIGGFWPDVTVLLDVTRATAERRLAARNEPKDRIEGKGWEFWDRVASLYRMQVRQFPQFCVMVDTEGKTPEEVGEWVLAVVEDRLRSRPRAWAVDPAAAKSVDLLTDGA